jgi:hypothetical protein
VVFLGRSRARFVERNGETRKSPLARDQRGALVRAGSPSVREPVNEQAESPELRARLAQKVLCSLERRPAKQLFRRAVKSGEQGEILG